MDIQTRKINFVQEFLRLRNTKLIEKPEKILIEEKAKNYEANLKPLSKDNFNKMIDESIEDSKQRNVVDVRELKASVKNGTSLQNSLERFCARTTDVVLSGGLAPAFDRN